MSRYLLLLAALGCGKPQSEPAPTAPVAPAPRDARALDALAPDAPRGVGRLYPKFEKTAVYPTRVCVAGTELVFENSCGCNDALLCTLDRSDKATLSFTLRTDPTRMKNCDDCFAMVPARCGVPPLADRRPGETWTIVINKQAAFELPLDGTGMPIDGSCWTQVP